MSKPETKETLVLHLIDLISLTVQKALPWALAILLVVVVKDATLSMTGSESLGEAWVEVTRNIRVSRGFALVFGVCGVLYGLQQRSLRRAERKRLLTRIAALEQTAGPRG